jgi:DNA-directed RNA polymerase subunit K/omega
MVPKIKKEDSDNENNDFDNDEHIDENDDENNDMEENEDDENDDDINDNYEEIDELYNDIEHDNENDNDFFNDNDNIKQNLEIAGEEYLIGNNRISNNRLTKYEMVRILGERIKQLTMGAKPLIKNYKGISYEKIAEEELLKNMIPFKIKRILPNGKCEIWTLDELYKEHLLCLLE